MKLSSNCFCHNCISERVGLFVFKSCTTTLFCGCSSNFRSVLWSVDISYPQKVKLKLSRRSDSYLKKNDKIMHIRIVIFCLYFELRAHHNCQIWKSRFLTCPCHIMYNVEAVGIYFRIILLKLRFLWVCEIWGHFMKIYILSITLIKGVLHHRPVLWLFMHFSQKLQHIGNK